MSRPLAYTRLGVSARGFVWAALLAAALLAVSGCGGINSTSTPQTTTVIVETVKAGTTDLLTVAATVVVQGIRGQVNLEDGWCVLSNVPLGTNDPPTAPLSVSAPGYVTVSKTIELSEYSYTPVTVEMTEADLTLTGTVEGHVTSSGGDPVTSAILRFTEAGVSGGTQITTFTDSAGYYIIRGVPAATVTVQVQALGYISQTHNAEVYSDSSGGNSNMDFVLIGGNTRVDVTGDVVSLTSGLPVSGATIVLGGEPEVTSAADGSFTVPEVLAGEQTIAVTADGFDPYNAIVSVAPGMNPVHVLMSPESPNPPPPVYSITGTVTLLGAPDNSGAVVNAFNIDRGQDMGSYTTAADGQYYLFVPSGQYRIEVTYGAHSISRVVELLPGRVLTGIDFALSVE